MRASDAKNKRGGISPEAGVPLTSLMDAMTIILLFLLQSFSADGNLIKKDEDSELANSMGKDKAKNLGTIYITPNKIKFKLDVTKDPISKYETEITEAFLADTLNFTVPNLLEGLEVKAKELDEREAELRKHEVDAGVLAEQTKRTILVEVDRKVPYKLVTKVMATCGEAGFSDIKLLTYGR